MHIYITGIFVHYSKCSNILNTFLFLFSDNMLVIKAGAHKTLVRITKKKGRPWSDCFWRSSLIWVWTACTYIFVRQVVFEILKLLLYIMFLKKSELMYK